MEYGKHSKKKRDGMMYGGNPKRVKANMGRSMYNKGGQPHYGNGEIPKAKPC